MAQETGRAENESSEKASSMGQNLAEKQNANIITEIAAEYDLKDSQRVKELFEQKQHLSP